MSNTPTPLTRDEALESIRSQIYAWVGHIAFSQPDHEKMPQEVDKLARDIIAVALPSSRPNEADISEEAITKAVNAYDSEAAGFNGRERFAAHRRCMRAALAADRRYALKAGGTQPADVLSLPDSDAPPWPDGDDVGLHRHSKDGNRVCEHAHPREFDRRA